MTQLFIPACGDRITLIAPWTFPLTLEHRNMQFANTHKLIDPSKVKEYGLWEGERWSGKYKVVQATLEGATVLECDRIYIRTFNKSRIHKDQDYDSITWKVIKNGKAAKHQRFWAKLPDCYSIEYTLQSDSLYRDRVKVVKLVMES